MQIVNQLKLEKPQQISPEATTTIIAKELQNNRQLYVTQNKQFLGIISAADLVRAVAERNKGKAKELMTTKVSYASPEDSAAQALRQMLKLNHYSLPVLQEKKILGILTIDNCLRGLK